MPVGVAPYIHVTYCDLAAEPALRLSSEHMAVFQGCTSNDATINADLIKGLEQIASIAV